MNFNSHDVPPGNVPQDLPALWLDRVWLALAEHDTQFSNYLAVYQKAVERAEELLPAAGMTAPQIDAITPEALKSIRPPRSTDTNPMYEAVMARRQAKSFLEALYSYIELKGYSIS